MANQNQEQWLLSHEERAKARSEGVDAYLLGKLGVGAHNIQIISSKRQHTETADGLIGHLAVRVDWHTPDGRWHMRNLRFNGTMPQGLEDYPEEFLTILGGFAERDDRQIEYRNYSIDAYGLPVKSQLQVDEIPPDLETASAPMAVPISQDTTTEISPVLTPA